MSSPAAAGGLAERIRVSAAALLGRGVERPHLGLVLETGLGGVADALEGVTAVDYRDVPDLAVTAVEGHAGRVVAGRLAGVPAVALQGRVHAYEGHSLRDVTFPVRVLRELGASVLVLASAAGGLDALFDVGDLMLIDDHLNLMGDNPLRGPNDEALGPRFPDLSNAYDAALRRAAEDAALLEGLRLRRGVYAAVPGPSLETAAECRFLRTAGADAVGMSTVPEAIVAAHAGLRVLGIAVITDRCGPDALGRGSLREIVRAAGDAEPQLRALLLRMATCGAFDSVTAERPPVVAETR